MAEGGEGVGGGGGVGGWSNNVMKDFQPMKKLSDVTGEVYSKARTMFNDVKAKIK